MILGLDHVQLAMPPGGEDAARAFYHGVLGMAEVEKPASIRSGGGCWFESGGAHVHLGVDGDFRPAPKAHPALLVDDLDALCARLAESGVAFVPGKPIPGYVRGDIVDPFGNRIELMEKR